jgi:signal transduction histidine kinase
MKCWAEQGPANYLHKFDLVEAEKHSLLNNILVTVELYEKSIAGAKENQFIQEEALANELAARFYFSWNKPKIAGSYLIEAVQCYVYWGAKTKVQRVKAQMPEVFLQVSNQGTGPVKKKTSKISQQEKLDLITLNKAYELISGQIHLDKLLASLMKFLIENMGAQFGYLILNGQNHFPSTETMLIEAEGRVNTDNIRIMQSLPLDHYVPHSLIQHVVQMQEPVILDNAVTEDLFKADPYITKNRSKSILSVPLISQGKFLGIVYLENNLATGVFTPDRLQLVQMLSSQAAISIENAQLYNNMEIKVAQRTEELSTALENLKAMQKQLVDSEKMAALGELVAGIAHEINTPVGIGVTAVSTLSDSALEFQKIVAGGKIKRSQLAKFIETTVQGSSIILNNLNKASQLIQSFKNVAVDQSSESKRSFYVKEYLNEILLSLRPKLKKTNHKVSIEGDEHLQICSYPGAVSQILTNFLINSILHAYDPDVSGTLQIRYLLENGHMHLTYSDDGKGILPENVKKIFNPFFTTNRGEGGTGLGLHIVYNLVTQRLKGTITCESELGKGTIFVIKWPVA